MFENTPDYSIVLKNPLDKSNLPMFILLVIISLFFLRQAIIAWTHRNTGFTAIVRIGRKGAGFYFTPEKYQDQEISKMFNYSFRIKQTFVKYPMTIFLSIILFTVSIILVLLNFITINAN